MTELAIRDETAVAVPHVRAELPVPAADDIDSGTRIVGQVVRLANEIYDTPFVPDGLRGSAPAVAAAILAGREMGIGPMTSLANIDVIRGKPAQKPVLMRALIESRGHKWETVENTDFRAVIRGCRKGESNWETVTFTADQARKAGLDLGKYPADKLYARASSRLAKHKFADVIMGMAYSSDEVEDGLDGEIPVTSDSETAAPAIEAPKARTAQRRQRTQTSPPAPAATPSADVAPPANAGGDLPPLPGEEDAPGPAPSGQPAGNEPAPGPGAHDTDYDTPGTVTNRQLTAIWTSLSQTYEFSADEKDQARGVCGQILRADLASSKDLSHNQAKTVLDTLAHWKAQAEQKGEHPRDYMLAMLVALDDPREGGEQA